VSAHSERSGIRDDQEIDLAPGRSEEKQRGGLSAVIADRLDRAALFRFLAAGFLFRVLRLFINVGITSIVIPFEIIGSSFPAKIAVNALIIDVVIAGDIFGVSVSDVCHKFLIKL
jgi:hypothetical protein